LVSDWDIETISEKRAKESGEEDIKSVLDQLSEDFPQSRPFLRGKLREVLSNRKAKNLRKYDSIKLEAYKESNNKNNKVAFFFFSFFSFFHLLGDRILLFFFFFFFLGSFFFLFPFTFPFRFCFVFHAVIPTLNQIIPKQTKPPTQHDPTQKIQTKNKSQ